jgi:hypothetical protein
VGVTTPKSNEFSMTIGEMDRPNKNGRIYPRRLWEEIIAEQSERVSGRQLPVYSRVDTYPKYAVNSMVGIVTRLYTFDRFVAIDWEVLPTETGKTWLPLIETGNYDIRPAGRGTVYHHKLSGFYYVDQDYQLEHMSIMEAGLGA